MSIAMTDLKYQFDRIENLLGNTLMDLSMSTFPERIN